jgi:chromate transporter
MFPLMGNREVNRRTLKELAALFFKLGFIGFGGPAAHIAMMEDEVVRRRKWISHELFLDLLGVTNLIPGPNSTEMAIHIGLVKAGWRGLLVAGICFIFPAVAIALIFAYLYVAYGLLPQLAPIITGIRPAVIAIILGALIRLARPISKSRFSVVVILFVAVLNLLRVNEIILLFLGGASGIIWVNREKFRGAGPSILVFAVFVPFVVLQSVPVLRANSPTTSELGLFFLKIGSVLYGSGYVLVAFLQTGLVESRHWLTQTQLFDAIAVGQFTPGPVLSTATFIGYLVLGIPGAAVATTGIFLPSFVFVFAISPFLSRIHNVPLARGFLDGVNAAALGLMLAVCITLGGIALRDPLAWALFLVAGALVIFRNLHPAWIVMASAAISWLASVIRI